MLVMNEKFPNLAQSHYIELNCIFVVAERDVAALCG